MTPTRRNRHRTGARIVWAVSAVSAVLCLACWTPVEDTPLGPSRSAGEAALRLFDLSLEGDPDPATLAFVLDDPRTDQDRAAALDAVASLKVASRPRILAETPLAVLDRTVVDVLAELPGGGEVRYSFQVEMREDGTWRIVAIEAPGVEWPDRRQKGSGLSVSAPVGEPAR